MKFKLDFVTNSSSTSFVCEICGYSDGGYDVGLSDLDLCECEQGHIFCKSHLDIKLEGEDDISSDICPICTLKKIAPKYVLDYIARTRNVDLDDIKTEIREKYKTFKKFKEVVK